MVLVQDASGSRAAKLIKTFWAVIKGEQQITTAHSAKLFVQACEIYSSKDSPVKFVEVLISNPAGIAALERVVRVDLTSSFINTTALPFLLTLSDEGVAALSNGGFLRQMLTAVLEPPTFWTAAVGAYHNDKLDNVGLEAFAWLCLQIVSDQTSFDYHKVAVKELMDSKSLLKTESPEVRKIAYRIDKIIKIFAQPEFAASGVTPGGRHDNDHANFRDISIYPTSDELLSTDPPYLQRLGDVFDTPMETRSQSYRDWLFRLLREDMLSELREDLQVAMSKKKSKRRPVALGELTLVGINADHDMETKQVLPYTLYVACQQGIHFPNKLPKGGKKAFITDSKNFMKDDSLGALCCNDTVIAFGSLARDVTNLLKTPPIVGIRFNDDSGLRKAIEVLQGPFKDRVKFFIVDTANFAYEPILKRLKTIAEMPLEAQLIDPEQPSQDGPRSTNLDILLTKFKAALDSNIKIMMPESLKLKKDTYLQGAQLKSFIHGISSNLALIQGPPGTGKSFLGALILLTILRLTKSRILVLSYTNHALDQFMEDLMAIGISSDQMVRLGSKSTEATKPTLLREYDRQKQYWLKPEERNIFNKLRVDETSLSLELQECSKRLAAREADPADILEHLELSENFSIAWEAFQVPEDDGFKTVGSDGKAIEPAGVYQYWLDGGDVNRLGHLSASLDLRARTVWNAPLAVRRKCHYEWSRMVREEQSARFIDLSKRFNDVRDEIKSIRDECRRRVLKDKQIIACTTTAAAMNQSIIETANPDVILVEEAGEILEAHIITAMSASVKQLILIGDHKQLRPKVGNYLLTKEKGEGYDLNVSLFERLVIQGRHFTALEEQHRSHPDISQYPRMLAYPELKDMPSTSIRQPIRGLKSRVTFVHHERPEDTMDDVAERRDPTAKATKRNLHEAMMVLRMVRYLSQNGYKTENMVVLTPYLGQLFLLKETLRKEMDPWLNDVDNHDLVRAGLVTQAAAKVNKKPLRLSTIDNYQGEECDIVIVSLTRSNASGDIGFLYARERLVVLLSRARNGMILFGNMETFMKSKKGGKMWTQYFDALKLNNSIFDGVPIHCERHPETSMLVKLPEDFDKKCPDGGCAEPCNAPLSCGKHKCQRRCHRVQNHSMIECFSKVDRTCDKGHKTKVPCGDKSKSCATCTKEYEDNQRRIKRDLELERARQEAQDKYRLELQKIEDEIDHRRRTMKYESEEKKQADELKQKKEELEALRQAESNKKKMKATQKTSPPPQNAPHFDPISSAANEWKNMKEAEGARNAALDKLMGMIGLESVKDQILSIKSTVDTKIRQGFSLGDERWSCSLLGNPGTGKTTVARIYAEFLTTVGAIAGSCFKEVTGSKLANMGVSGCEKLIEDVNNNGGGCVFIDEAYQLSSGNSPGGKAVLDYLLAEVENLRGKVVFVLAGYSKEMESFFSHNPGIPSRFPIEMKFEDYTDKELLQILQLQIHRKFQGRMTAEQGTDGLFCRIAVRRVGHGRGKNGFGNARAVENCLQKISQRQAARLRRERRAGKKPNDLLLTQEDIIGPEPSEALLSSKAYRELKSLIGLQEVKDALGVLMDTLRTNYEREIAEQPLVEFSLNKVFLGSPGTGKTTVAKLYGEILKDLGLLSNGEVVTKNPADFVGAALGQSEAQTKGILASTVGKVLLIDEAYGLYGGGGANGSVVDPYKTAVIDTIVAEVQSVPGEDRCVLLLGYKEQMEEMFQNVNPGLSRRFPISSAFVFEDLDDVALAKILDLKLGKSGFKATTKAKVVALDVLRRARNRPNFGNAGEIDILLGRAMANHQKRVSSGQVKRHGTLEPIDFDQDFDRAEKGDTDVKKLFEGDVGRDHLISILQGYQTRVRQAKQLEIDPEIPFNFLFRGPPGTGKTTAARKMGQVYYDLGFLASTEVIEVSATELIGQYVGHTGPKVQQLLDKALGRVLFIDEAYRLASESSFAREAVDELVDCVTKPKYHGKLIIILAGYVQDINTLLGINPGMSSRFPESIDFDPLTPTSCIQLITSQLQDSKAKLKGKIPVDLSCLERPERGFLTELSDSFEELSKQDSWANARDVKELAKKMFHKFDLSSKSLKLTEELVRSTIDDMMAERRGRMTDKKPTAASEIAKALNDMPSFTPPTTTTNATTVTEEQEEEEPEEELPAITVPQGIRDAGVSDEVWEQLQRDKEQEAKDEEEFRRLKKAQQNASDADREKLVRKILAEEEKRKKIEARKAKLMKMGVCPAGFQWIKQSESDKITQITTIIHTMSGDNGGVAAQADILGIPGAALNTIGFAQGLLRAVSADNANPNAVIQVQQIGSCFQSNGPWAAKIPDVLSRASCVRLERLSAWVGWAKDDTPSFMSQTTGGQTAALLCCALGSLYSKSRCGLLLYDLCRDILPADRQLSSPTQLGEVCMLLERKSACLGFGNHLALQVTRLRQCFFEAGLDVPRDLADTPTEEDLNNFLSGVCSALQDESLVLQVSGTRCVGTLLALTLAMCPEDVSVRINRGVLMNGLRDNIIFSVTTEDGSSTHIHLETKLENKKAGFLKRHIIAESQHKHKEELHFICDGILSSQLDLSLSMVGVGSSQPLKLAISNFVASLAMEPTMDCFFSSKSTYGLEKRFPTQGLRVILGPTYRQTISQRLEKVLCCPSDTLQCPKEAFNRLQNTIRVVLPLKTCTCSSCKIGEIWDVTRHPEVNSKAFWSWIHCPVSRLWRDVAQITQASLLFLFLQYSLNTTLRSHTGGATYPYLIELIWSRFNEARGHESKSIGPSWLHKHIIRLVGYAIPEPICNSSGASTIYPATLEVPEISSPWVAQYELVDGRLHYQADSYDFIIPVMPGTIAAEALIRPKARGSIAKGVISVPSGLGEHSSLLMTLRPALTQALLLRCQIKQGNSTTEVNFLDMHLGLMSLNPADSCDHDLSTPFDPTKDNLIVKATSVMEPVASGKSSIGVTLTHRNKESQFLCCSETVSQLYQGDCCLPCAVAQAMRENCKVIIGGSPGMYLIIAKDAG
ncbi:NFX1-type zinc finger-containing protein [Fusarium mundagurra]|uniref:NFX1-type zinc finger-containing protein n=1 Tax=Fusarium mundagurra TaxID=1567541 RepID=A0A8H5Y2T3_9HYPO|nr:NFX1-type zinc finger-containing protein [Fusarium mundagurra]